MVSQNAQTKAERFLFSTSFDEARETAQEGDRRQPPPPTFLAEDLARAEEVGFAAGHEAGLAEARASQEQVVAQALAQLEQQLASAEAGLAEQHAQRQRNAVEVALTALGKLFPDLAHRHGLDECMALIGSCLERLDDEPRLVIRVAEEAFDPLKARMEGLTQRCGYEGRVILLGDNALGTGDLRIEWADGGAERDSERLWQEIDQILAGAGMARECPAPSTTAAPAEADRAAAGPEAEPQRAENRMSAASAIPTQESDDE